MINSFRFFGCLLLSIISYAAFPQGNFIETNKQENGFHYMAGFGGALDISGDLAIVGEDLSNDWYLSPLGGLIGGSQSGRAVIFQRNGGNGNSWSLITNLLRSDPDASDFFGVSTAISVDYALVGAHGNDDNGSMSGSAYIFGRNIGGANQWGEIKKLKAADAGTQDIFGQQVSLSGEWALIGAEQNDDNGSNSGSAYLFYKDQGGIDNWGQVIELHAPDATAGNRFGSSVKILGDIAFVGAKFKSLGGAVYIFYRNQGGPNNWGFVKKISNSNWQTGVIGGQLSASGDFLLTGGNSKEAQLYSRHSGGSDNWGLVKRFSHESFTSFGNSISVSGDNVFIGVYDNTNQVYWYQKDLMGIDNWGLVKKLEGSTAGPGDNFGSTLYSLNDELFVISPVEAFIYCFNGVPQPPGVNASIAINIQSEYSLSDNDSTQLFSAVTINDADIPNQNLLTIITLQNSDIGSFSSPFIKQNDETFYFYGTLSETQLAIQSLEFQPSPDLVANGQTVSSGMSISIDDGVLPPTIYQSEIVTTSINEAPVVIDAKFQIDFSVPLSLSQVVGTIVVSDTDPGQTLSFAITSGNNGNHFAINNQGEITMSSLPNPQQQIEYVLTVSVTDNGNPVLASYGEVIITLTRNDYSFVKEIAISNAGLYGLLAVDISSTIAVVGDGYDIQAGAGAGAVRVYYKDQGGENMWGMIKKILPPVAQGSFGGRVRIDQDLLYVSATGDDQIAADAGALYIYQKDLGGVDQWGLLKKLTLPTLHAGDAFGFLAISGDTLLVSAFFDDDKGSNSGAAYVFYRNQDGANQWGLVAKLTAPDGVAGDLFGHQLGISHGRAFVSSPYNDGTGDGQTGGAAYMYSIGNDGAFTFQSKLNFPRNGSPSWSENIGAEIRCSLFAGNFVTGDRDPFAYTSGSGIVRMYSEDPITKQWGFLKQIPSPDITSFGYSLHLENNLLTVLSYGMTSAVFEKNWGGLDNWGLVQKLSNPHNDLFSVEVFENNLIFGKKTSSGENLAVRIWSKPILQTSQFILQGAAELNVNDNESATPFSDVTMDGYADDITVVISSDNIEKGSFSNYEGFTLDGQGSISMTGSVTEITEALHAITFTPTNNRVTPGESEECVFTIQVTHAGEVILTNSNTILNIVSVNDSPSFTAGQNIQVFENSQSYSQVTWATVISDGDIESQELTFHLSTNNDLLFSVLPSISAVGTLSFTLNPEVHGQATVTVYLADDGVANNESALQQFTITVNTTPVLFIVDDSTVRRNHEVLIPVTVQNFENILGVQFSVSWDPLMMEFIGLEDFNLSGLDLTSFNLSESANGQISIVWSEPSIIAQDIADGESVFSLRFNPVGDYNSDTEISITSSPTAIEVIDNSYSSVNTQTQAGLIHISEFLNIHGIVQYPNDESVQNVVITLSGSSSSTAYTNENGEYMLTVEPSVNMNYTITPSKTLDPDLLNGIDVQDVASIRRHILTTELFDSPFQVIAADVNNSSHVSIHDIILLQALILGVESNFPNGRQWTFIDSNHSFSSPTSPFPYPQQKNPTLVELDEDIPQSFTAIKIGDVNLTRDNSQSGKIKKQDVVLEIGSTNETENGIIEVEIRALGFVDIAAYQFTIQWNKDHLEYLQNEMAISSVRFGEHKLQEGFLTTMWDEPQGTNSTLSDMEILMKLKFKKLTSEEPDTIAVHGNLTPMKMFDKELNEVNLTIRKGTEESKENAFFHPNPFVLETKISFSAIKDQIATFHIVDMTGKTIETSSISINKGWNEKVVDGSKLRPGLYYFKLQLFDRIVISKMVKAQN